MFSFRFRHPDDPDLLSLLILSSLPSFISLHVHFHIHSIYVSYI